MCGVFVVRVLNVYGVFVCLVVGCCVLFVWYASLFVSVSVCLVLYCVCGFVSCVCCCVFLVVCECVLWCVRWLFGVVWFGVFVCGLCVLFVVCVWLCGRLWVGL